MRSEFNDEFEDEHQHQHIEESSRSGFEKVGLIRDGVRDRQQDELVC